MRDKTRRSASAWELVRRQHGVVTRKQLLALGFTPKAIAHRLADGRLHRVYRGAYAVGRPDLTLYGSWMAAVFACGPTACLSHLSAAALWGIRNAWPTPVHVSVRARSPRCPAGIVVHRRTALTPADVTRRHDIPVTDPVCTLIDIAPRLTRDALEAAINDADGAGLIDPDRLRSTLERTEPRPGVGVLRETLDRRTFTFTRSQLERRFLPIAREAGLSNPQTNVWLNGFEVDFYFEELGLDPGPAGPRARRAAGNGR